MSREVDMFVPLDPRDNATGAACNCGCQEAGDGVPYPAGLADVPPDASAVQGHLLVAGMTERSYPWPGAREEAYQAKAAEMRAAREDALGAPAGTLDGRAALRQLAVRSNPDGSNLTGSTALARLRDLGIAGVGHEPGCRP